MLRTFVAAGHGTSMVFQVSIKGKVVHASPRMPQARGKSVRFLKVQLRRSGFAFYEVA